MKYMLDANVLRHLAAQDAGSEHIFKRVQEIGIKHLCLSSIVAAELHKTIHNHKLERAERLMIKKMLDALNVMDFGMKAAEVAGEAAAQALRKGKALSTPDYMIAGHALMLGCIMVTDNLKHFEGIAGLKVENWRKPK